MRRVFILLFAFLFLLPISSPANSFFCFTDPLAPRDDYGLLHQSPRLNPTDFAPRYPCRVGYYFTPAGILVADPAYVGALQTSLYRHGYYCGPIDGVFSTEVSAAIARMQKNYSQRVTGTLTFGVRRALHLP
jgi:putative peptidoglycan binding protein